MSWAPLLPPTCQRWSAVSCRRFGAAWQCSSTSRLRMKSNRASGSVSMPPRSDHWLQRSARALRIKAESRAGPFPEGGESPCASARLPGTQEPHQACSAQWFLQPSRLPGPGQSPQPEQPPMPTPGRVSPAPKAMPRRTERCLCSASNSAGKQERRLSARQSPANTPRHRLSMATSASCGTRVAIARAPPAPAEQPPAAGTDRAEGPGRHQCQRPDPPGPRSRQPGRAAPALCRGDKRALPPLHLPPR